MSILSRIDTTKVKHALTDARFTPIQLLIIAMGMGLDIVTQKDVVELIMNLMQDILILLTGAKMSNLKGVIKDLRTVITDPKTTLTEKMNGVMNLVITGCAMAGEIQEVMNKYPIDRFITKIEPEKLE